MNAQNAKALFSLAALLCLMAALIFIAAGTVDYWQAWLFLIVYFASSLGITLYLIMHDSELLQRRMRGGPAAEKQPIQKIIVSLTSLAFTALLVVPALDHRYGWSAVPRFVELFGDALLGLGFLGVLRVFQENSYASSTIEVSADQRVISKGPYALVRHPMYAGALGVLLAIPISLGSYIGLTIFAAIAAGVVWRLLNEERFLAANLPGYPDYQRKVRYRLIPGVW